MSEELNFSIPETSQKGGRSGSRLLLLVMTAVLLAVLADMGIGLIRGNNDGGRPQNALLSPEQQKRLALKLEKQGLNREAVVAWKEYLANSVSGDEDAARIWYRIGRLYQEENQYAMALDGFYRSEGFSKPDDITPEVARRIQECLEATGRFAALRYDLADRVGGNAKSADGDSGIPADEIVAEIGPQKIMKSDLDRIIEHRIEQQLSQLASYLPEDQINTKKEELLKQYSTDQQRQIFLNQYLMEEILFRKARESRLADEAGVRAALKQTERSLLAAKLMEKTLTDAIKITPGDIKTYYEANKPDYIHPEKARISHILVSGQEQAQDVRKRLESGRDFAGLAADVSQDDTTRKNGGELPQWIAKTETGDIPGIGKARNGVVNIFSTPEGHVVDKDIETDRGIHIIKVLERKPERQKSFDEAKNEVYIALRSRKEREVQQNLLSELKAQYDVVVHHTAFRKKRE